MANADGYCQINENTTFMRQRSLGGNAAESHVNLEAIPTSLPRRSYKQEFVQQKSWRSAIVLNDYLIHSAQSDKT